jgi:hypothetical protein
VRAELFRPDAPDAVVAVATWDDGRSSLDVTESIEGLDRILRATPVVVPGGFPQQLGATGDTLEQPGTLGWFRAALLERAPTFGLDVRFVAADVRNGWDPAANYRTFEQQEWRIASGDPVAGASTTGPGVEDAEEVAPSVRP